MYIAQTTTELSVPMIIGAVLLFIIVAAGTLLYFLNKKSTQAEIQWGPLEAVTITIAGYFIAQIAAATLVAGANTIPAIEPHLGNEFILNLFITLVFYGLYGWFIASFIKKRGSTLKQVGLKVPMARDLGVALAGFFVYLVLGTIITALVGEYTQIDVNQQQQLGFDTTLSGVKLLGVFISLVILAPFVEEFVTRGFLYSGLRTKLSFIPTAIVTSIIFGIAHLQLGSGTAPLWIAAIDTFILSLVLVYLRERYDSLWPAISLHAFKNGLAFTVLFVLKIPLV